jgi:hypothetical protein
MQSRERNICIAANPITVSAGGFFCFFFWPNQSRAIWVPMPKYRSLRTSHLDDEWGQNDVGR